MYFQCFLFIFFTKHLAQFYIMEYSTILGPRVFKNTFQQCTKTAPFTNELSMNMKTELDQGGTG